MSGRIIAAMLALSVCAQLLEQEKQAFNRMPDNRAATVSAIYRRHVQSAPSAQCNRRLATVRIVPTFRNLRT